MGKLYKAGVDVREAIAKQTMPREKKRDEVLAIADKRLKKLSLPMHLAGFALDTEYRKIQLQERPEVLNGLIWVLRKILPDKEEHKAALKELQSFRDGTGLLGHELIQDMASNMAAHTWWDQYGTEAPHLHKVMKVLSLVTSSSACERNWSTYGFIHSRLRNRLTPARARKLVWEHNNLRLLGNVTADNYEAEYHVWQDEDEEEMVLEVDRGKAGPANKKQRRK